MSQLLRSTFLLLSAGALGVLPGVALGAQVRGTLDPGHATHESEVLGYSKTRVAAPGPATQKKADAAVFLKVKDSLTLPAPTSWPSVRLVGYQLSPQVVSCAVDGKVTFVNGDRAPLTVKVDGRDFALIGPGESKDYECVVGRPGEDLRPIRIQEWPYARGLVFVNDVGVAAQINERGAFSLAASPGKFELQVVELRGVVLRKDLELGKGDLDVGALAVPAEVGVGHPATP